MTGPPGAAVMPVLCQAPGPQTSNPRSGSSADEVRVQPGHGACGDLANVMCRPNVAAGPALRSCAHPRPRLAFCPAAKQSLEIAVPSGRSTRARFSSVPQARPLCAQVTRGRSLTRVERRPASGPGFGFGQAAVVSCSKTAGSYAESPAPKSSVRPAGGEPAVEPGPRSWTQAPRRPPARLVQPPPGPVRP